jgi:hypothetical protein
MAWSKQHALEYVDSGCLLEAISSMGSDLGRHPETKMDSFLLMAGAMYALDGDVDGVRRWIEGFR